MNEQMKDYINAYTNGKRISNVINCSLKDTDDEDGAAGEHYIVKCTYEGETFVNTCLVSVLSFRRFVKKTEILDVVKWLRFDEDDD